MSAKIQYKTVVFTDTNPNNGYKARKIDIPIGAVITGNTVKYTINGKGELVDQAGKVIENNTIPLTKPQLAAIEAFANIDGDMINITPDELRNGGGWGICESVAENLKKFGSLFRLSDPNHGANAGEGPFASAEFERDYTEEELNTITRETAKNVQLTSFIGIDLRDCEK